MTGHRISYRVDERPGGTSYTGTCRCGATRTAATSAAISSWGPKHVVTAWDAEHALSRS